MYDRDASNNIIAGSWWPQKIYATITNDSGTKLNLRNKKGSFYRCPSAVQDWNSITADSQTQVLLLPYAANCYILLRRMDLAVRPSMCVMTADSDGDAYYDCYMQWSYYPMGNRHTGTAMAGFVDGHAEQKKASEWNAPDATVGSMTSSGATITRSYTGSIYSWATVPVKLLTFWGASQKSGNVYTFDYFAWNRGNPR